LRTPLSGDLSMPGARDASRASFQRRNPATHARHFLQRIHCHVTVLK
jgi:hypothetical protein